MYDFPITAAEVDEFGDDNDDDVDIDIDNIGVLGLPSDSPSDDEGEASKRSSISGVVGLGYIDCPGWGSHYMVFDIDVNQPRSQFFSKIQQGSKKIQ